MLVYLAGAIDLVSEEDGKSWRDSVKEMLLSRGISVFDPKGAFSVYLHNRDDVEALVNINRFVLKKSDYALFLFNPRHNSIGTPIELYLASQVYNIPHIVVWNDPDYHEEAPLPAYITAYANKIVFSLSDAVDEIEELHKAQNEIRKSLDSTH